MTIQTYKGNNYHMEENQLKIMFDKWKMMTRVNMIFSYDEKERKNKLWHLSVDVERLVSRPVIEIVEDRLSELYVDSLAYAYQLKFDFIRANSFISKTQTTHEL